MEKLKERLHFVGAPSQSRHTVFVDDEAEARSFSAEAYFDTPKELLGRAFNRPRREQLAEAGAVTGARGEDLSEQVDNLERWVNPHKPSWMAGG